MYKFPLSTSMNDFKVVAESTVRVSKSRNEQITIKKQEEIEERNMIIVLSLWI